MYQVKRWRSLVLSCVVVAGVGQAQEFKGMTLTVLGVNSDLNQIYTQTYGAEFEKETGAKLVIATGSTNDNLSKALIAKNRVPNFQVIALEDLALAQAIRAGAIQKVDYSQMPRSKDLAKGAVPVAGYGPSFDFFRFGTCINVAQYKAHNIRIPTGVDGWFDPAVAGHTILPTPSNFWWATGMQALAESENVPLADPRPLFIRLQTMKPTSLYTASGDAQAQLESGSTWLAPTSDGRCYAMKLAGQPVEFIPLNLKIGGKTYGWAFGVDTWQIPSGVTGKELALAHRFIDASLIPQAQLVIARKFGYPPTTNTGLKMAMDLPEAKRVNMYGDHFSFDQMYSPDPQKLLPYLDQWIAQWNTMFSR
jgi:spermidine/putrescine-binding protein